MAPTPTNANTTTHSIYANVNEIHVNAEKCWSALALESAQKTIKIKNKLIAFIITILSGMMSLHTVHELQLFYIFRFCHTVTGYHL